ncbi:hypothetical protein [Nocardioides sp. TF02-7]|uniref:hypothetical protein n=1 Tax=Nocardioides sp. TF02-7 TaxID=2917724 RepID=UPI001F06FD89|nr:hypothetical protein [Nocardioides sp. TF02-7]UMG91404.1 hypothetical protein MF408_14760 [Nocardioides sp. TF02-7]
MHVRPFIERCPHSAPLVDGAGPLAPESAAFAAFAGRTAGLAGVGAVVDVAALLL